DPVVNPIRVLYIRSMTSAAGTTQHTMPDIRLQQADALPPDLRSFDVIVMPDRHDGLPERALRFADAGGGLVLLGPDRPAEDCNRTTLAVKPTTTHWLTQRIDPFRVQSAPPSPGPLNNGEPVLVAEWQGQRI